MANQEQANVGSKIFYHGIARCDFPELFEKALNGESYRGLSLDDMVVFLKRLEFVFKTEDGSKASVEVPLKGTCGKIQINKGENKFAIMEWTNGEMRSFDKMIFGKMTHMIIQND
jgi:hypothetical protein